MSTLGVKALMILSNIQEIERKNQFVTHGLKTGESEDMTHWSVGFYPPSVAYPRKHFQDKAVDLTFCSPNGGECIVDRWGAELWDHPVVMKVRRECDEQLKNTVPAKNLKGADYDIIHFAGSHGAFFDIHENEEVGRLARECYEAGGYLSANSDGVVGLLNVKLSNGEWLVKGKNITGMTKAEQDELDCRDDIGWYLVDKLIEQGANYKWCKIKNKDHFKVDQRIITGQNPNSAEPLSRYLGTLCKKLLKDKKVAAMAAAGLTIEGTNVGLTIEGTKVGHTHADNQVNISVNMRDRKSVV